MIHFYVVKCLLLLGFAWSDITWRPWQAKAFGENVYPHLNLSLHLWERMTVLNKAIIQQHEDVNFTLCSHLLF